MSTLSLYEVASEFRALAGRLESMDIDEQTLHDTLEGERYPVEKKAQAVAMVCKNLEATAEAYAAHASQINDRAKSIMKRADWLKTYLLMNMEACGISEISSPGLSAKIKNNPPSVDIYDASQLPEKFMRQPPAPPPAPDKKAISSAIKSGEEVTGARLTQGKRLIIE